VFTGHHGSSLWSQLLRGWRLGGQFQGQSQQRVWDPISTNKWSMVVYAHSPSCMGRHI
jgi:hypothetical protein